MPPRDAVGRPGERHLAVEKVAELRRHPGSRREVRRSIPAGELVISSARVPDGADLDLDLVIESLSEGLVVSGAIAVPWEGACRRCLGPVTGTVVAEIREVYDPHPIEDETWPLHGDTLDLGPMARDMALLELPLAPLCGDDCPGPAPETFPTVIQSDGPAPSAGDDPQPPTGDPRWAALDALDFDS